MRLSIEEIDVPFPLNGQLDSIISRYTKKINGKSPNSFILYRKALNIELSSHGYYLQAKEISSIASKKWKAKSSLIKEEYRKIATRISKMVDEIHPNRIISYKKREKKKNRRSERVQPVPLSIGTSIQSVNSDSEESTPITPPPYYSSQQNNEFTSHLNLVDQSDVFHESQSLKNWSYMENFSQNFNIDMRLEPCPSSSCITETLTHIEQNDSFYTELLLSLMNWESEEYFQITDFQRQ
ncbi:13732_t:CDS:1 [Ambispora leptoticha]|uniref:13732_t:CDS:1 n=1 Tax=Ambispora leptoticha TaxID=144679 RepID=A0A9N8ZHI1_9GLOM|nr:13732_t:CDS:1 [Ambispora leptoticha]